MLVNNKDKTRYSWFHYNAYFENENLFQCHWHTREQCEHNVNYVHIIHIMQDFIYKKHRWMQKTAPRWTKPQRNICNTHVHTPLNPCPATSVHWVCYELHSSTSGVCYNFPSNFRQPSFQHFTMTHKLQLFWCSLSQANFRSFSR